MITKESSETSEEQKGRFAYEGLDRILHEKARLGIMTCLLSKPEGLIFKDIKSFCDLTDGNLSRHLQILNEAGLVEIWKGFQNKRPQTLCRLNEEGRKRFLKYVQELEGLLRDVASVSQNEPQKELPPHLAPA
ncbi:MAG: transcriptional regulator [Planctomycetota bacterium]|nr:transcriptional regulator [Planctomycetota bacterium]